MSHLNGAALKALPPTVLEQLRRDLCALKLQPMAEYLDEALLQAQKTEPGYIAFLAGLISRQVLATTERAQARRLHQAGFPCVKTFDGFDYVQRFIM